MTAAQRATLEEFAKELHGAAYALLCCDSANTAAEARRIVRRADALRAALGTCGNCAHADTENAPDGSAYCTARMDDAHPFAALRMPLGERCTGWTARDA